MGRKKRQPTEIATIDIPAPAAPSPPPVDPERVEQVIQWLLEGHRDFDVLESIAATWPDQVLPPLLTAVANAFAQDAQFEQDVTIGWCLAAYKQIYRRMLELGDLVGALRAVKEIRQLAERFGQDKEADDRELNQG